MTDNIIPIFKGIQCTVPNSNLLIQVFHFTRKEM